MGINLAAPDKEERTRRAYLKGVVGGGLSLNVLSTHSEWIVEQQDGSPVDEREDSSGNRPVRRSIESLTRSDPNGILDSYRDAIQEMRTLPDSDPRSWQNQAFIHGRSGQFAECEHNNWLFLPWHRAYIFFFEDICRELSGNPDFALPFWNWIENPRIPAVFDGGPDDPLYDPDRFTTSSSAPAQTDLIGPLIMQAILNEPNFLRVGGGWEGALNPNATKGDGGGLLESPPHNHMHAYAGGDMNTASSPLDPLFWTHHCMIDRLWWLWSGNPDHLNPDDEDWSGASFAGDFVDRDGERVEEIDVLRTLSMPSVAYNYETTSLNPQSTTSSAGPPDLSTLAAEDRSATTQSRETETESPGGGTEADPEEIEEVREQVAPVDLELVDRSGISEDLVVRVGDPVSVSTDVFLDDVRPYLDGENRGRIELSLTEITPPQRDDFFVRVFVNLPDATMETTSETPHYAGGISFFVDEEREHELSYLIDVTDTIRELHRREQIPDDEPLSVQFVAASLRGRESDEQFMIGTLRLNVTRSIVDEEVVEQPPLEGDRCSETIATY